MNRPHFIPEPRWHRLRRERREERRRIQRFALALALAAAAAWPVCLLIHLL